MKKRLLAALLAAGLLGLAGCEMVSINRDKDKAQVVAKIGDTAITKGELYDAAQADLTSNGYDIDLWDESLDDTTRTAVEEYLMEYFDSYVQTQLVNTVCEKEYTLTAEEEAQIQENVTSYEDYIKLILGYDDTNPSAYTGDIEADIDSYLESMGTSREKISTSSRAAVAYTKVHDALTAGVAATEEQVQARYNTDLASQKEAYAASGRTGYETAITSDSLGDYILYKPVDYAVVKHIVLLFTDEENTQYQAALTVLTDAQDERDTVEAAYDDAQTKAESAQAALGEAQAGLATAQQNNDAAAISEYQAAISANTELINTQTAQMNTQAALLVNMEANVADAEHALTVQKTKMLAKYQKTVNEIMARLHNGESFDALMAQYNDDGGADSGSIAGLGYVVSPQTATYYDEFEQAALSMTERGQISDPVVTEAGIHILYAVYVSAEEVDIPYDTVKTAVKTAEDATVIEAAWQAKLAELEDKYNVQTWPKRIKFVQ